MERILNISVILGSLFSLIKVISSFNTLCTYIGETSWQFYFSVVSFILFLLIFKSTLITFYNLQFHEPSKFQIKKVD